MCLLTDSQLLLDLTMTCLSTCKLLLKLLLTLSLVSLDSLKLLL